MQKSYTFFATDYVADVRMIVNYCCAQVTLLPAPIICPSLITQYRYSCHLNNQLYGHYLGRSNSIMLLEDTAEMGWILETEAVSHICNGHLRRLEHLMCFRQSLLTDPLGRCFAVDTLEITFETGERTS